MFRRRFDRDKTGHKNALAYVREFESSYLEELMEFIHSSVMDNPGSWSITDESAWEDRTAITIKSSVRGFWVDATFFQLINNPSIVFAKILLDGIDVPQLRPKHAKVLGECIDRIYMHMGSCDSLEKINPIVDKIRRMR